MNTIELLNAHRSIRKYQSRPIPPEVMERLLNCAMRASNTGNMQLYSIIVTQEQPLLGQLSQLHFGQGSTAPAFITVCVDVHRYHHWCRQRGCDEPYGNFLWLMSGTVDASLAAANLATAAEAEGIGFCFLGTVMYNTKAIAELLHLPTGVVPVATLSIGYPDEQPPQSERLPMEGVVHSETYHDYSDDDIDRIHKLREEFPFNRQMVQENHVRNLAELFTTVRYPRKDNEAISKALKEFCEQAGF